MTATETMIRSNGAAPLEPESDSALFHRSIDFHQARKHYNGFGNESSSDFKLVTLNPTSGGLKPSGLEKITEKSSEISEAGLDPELSFEITFRRIGAGLRNLGNTCFLNSVLQCLTYTAPLAAYLQSGKHQNSCCTAGFCALCAIQKHVSRALQSSGRILEPKDLVSNLRCISRSFRNARQEDAHEYMVNLLESMHRCCLPSGVPSESPSAYEKSLVHKIFGGQLRSQVKCMQCSHCSNKFDPFLDLSLEIHKSDSLHKALAHFTSRELLDGGAREYLCDQCKEKVKASKQLTVQKAPLVLAVHLKRFSSYAPGQKVDKRVAFEPTLDLKPFVSDPYDGDLKYTLYGVLVHYGWSTHSGHYYCFVRTSSGMWYSLDDNQVVQVNERKVLEQKAYMLFYVRDRKDVGTENHVNTFQQDKDNMVMNAIGNVAYSNLNMELKEKIQIGSNERELNGSSALSGRIAPATDLPNGKLTVEPLDLAINAKCASMKPPTQSQLKEDSPMKLNSSVNGSGGASSGGYVATCHNILSIVEEHSTSSIVLSVAMPSGCKDNDKVKPSESAQKAPDSAVLSRLSGDQCKMDAPISETNASTKSLPVGAIDEPEKNICDGRAPVSSCIDASSMKAVGPNTDITVENGQRLDVHSKVSNLPAATTEPVSYCIEASTMKAVGPNTDATVENGRRLDEQSNLSNSPAATTEPVSSCIEASTMKAVGPTTDVTVANGQRMDVQSKLSNLPSATTEPVRLRITKKKSQDLKVKWKLMKYQAVAASLSSNIVLGVGLCLKIKKHKKKLKKTHSSMLKKSPGLKVILIEKALPSKVGQPASVEAIPPAVDQSTCSRKKKGKRVSDGQNHNPSIQNTISDSSILGAATDKDFRERILVDESTVSAGKQLDTRHSTAQGTGISQEHQRELRQNDIMNMLTRGLDETTVGRWKDNGAALYTKSKTRAPGTAQIGCIGNEWDEEYDRGKRKKIRLPAVSFDGPNLFQEIADKRLKTKRLKLERSRDGNQPFRI
ncbi:ubiquitin carboxyl-terminal hydrolase 23-like [Salvia splendens]|uniref:ubiquitin carboxyl-terminal hydrolase 23-like n=1 Tax=Salvia splendens TaxID=180675 RepID=UPI001C2756E0|nr:ubiquitin carboxyl-terminal hydrolase 23-like [Salvia splendens]